MNKNLYPIGSFEKETAFLQQLVNMIATEATRLFCVGGDEWFLDNLINCYRLAKEGY